MKQEDLIRARAYRLANIDPKKAAVEEKGPRPPNSVSKLQLAAWLYRIGKRLEEMQHSIANAPALQACVHCGAHGPSGDIAMRERTAPPPWPESLSALVKLEHVERFFAVHCKNCGASAGECRTAAEAANTWNERGDAWTW